MHSTSRARERALTFLEETKGRGYVLGLAHMYETLQAFDNPHRNLAYIHIAGTNGKGSTTTYMASCLQEAGYRVGSYTSPAILHMTDRIQINGHNIPEDELVALLLEIQEKTESHQIFITEFEVITTAALLYFARKNVDVVLLEVGMGGRLDATNCIDHKELAIFTKIGLDHTDYLGTTLTEIAKEKAGIIGEKTEVIALPQEEEVIQVLKDVTEQKGGRFHLAQAEKISFVEETSEGNLFQYDGIPIVTSMTGHFQLENALLALEALHLLEDRFPVKKEALQEGMKKAHIPGRFQRIWETPTVWVDGAHNPQGVEALKQNLENLYKKEKIHFIMGSLRDKDYGKSISILGPLAQSFALVPTLGPRGLEPYVLKLETDAYAPSQCFSSVEGALSHHLKEIKEGVIVVFGSLTLVQEAIDYFQG